MNHPELSRTVRVFTPSDPALDAGTGGNPATVTLDADGLSDAELQAVAERLGHESAFVLAPPDGTFDFAFRFFAPNFEMEMCGHATVGTLWVLRRLGRWPKGKTDVTVWTKSGPVHGRLLHAGTPAERVAVSQPKGRIWALPDPIAHAARIAEVLGVTDAERAAEPIVNASTSRIKTLVPLTSAAAVNALRPDFTRMEALCEDIGSTGLYPYAIVDREARIVEARQFPKEVGYPEDAATGVAVTALAFALLEGGVVAADERPIRVIQGRAMGQPSELVVSFEIGRDGPTQCWLTGLVADLEPQPHAVRG
ncbi:PhzF family phenazine biosynthesis protein [Pendulispora albinea]|uniref:PhzF family phenazine biosynthesis protein n=1 Tax=Pendulispora albinea TaxID=2741071 RepID=A0ABZ2M4K9_9BACT